MRDFLAALCVGCSIGSLVAVLGLLAHQNAAPIDFLVNSPELIGAFDQRDRVLLGLGQNQETIFKRLKVLEGGKSE